jgi:hypothetical protein
MSVDNAATPAATDFLPIHGTEASVVLILIAIVALICLYAWILADQNRS